MMPIILIGHMALRTILPALLHANLQRDQVEGFAWGFEHQWGYAKHPPLWAWMLEATVPLTGAPSAWAAYALGAGSGAAALFILFILARRFATPAGAVAATLAMEGILYLNFRTVDFNANVVLLPFWALAGLFVYRAISLGRLSDWIGLGLAVALGLYGKYATFILIVVIGLFLLIDPVARRHLKTRGPWVAALTALVTLTPHLLWLVDHGAGPMGYAMARTGQTAGLISHFSEPILFTVKQVPEVLGFLILSAILISGPKGHDRIVALVETITGVQRRLILCLAVGPMALTILICAVLGRPFVAAWALPMFLFWGPALVVLAPRVRAAAMVRFLWAVPAVCAVCVISFVVYYGVLPDLRHKAGKTQFPGRGLALAVTQAWAKAVPDQGPPALIAGPIYVAGNAALYIAQKDPKARPHVLIDGDFNQSPWMTPADVARKGLVMVWLDEGRGAPDYLARFPGAEMIDIPPIPFERVSGVQPLRIGLAVVRPTAP